MSVFFISFIGLLGFYLPHTQNYSHIPMRCCCDIYLILHFQFPWGTGWRSRAHWKSEDILILSFCRKYLLQSKGVGALPLAGQLDNKVWGRRCEQPVCLLYSPPTQPHSLEARPAEEHSRGLTILEQVLLWMVSQPYKKKEWARSQTRASSSKISLRCLS